MGKTLEKFESYVEKKNSDLSSFLKKYGKDMEELIESFKKIRGKQEKICIPMSCGVLVINIRIPSYPFSDSEILNGVTININKDDPRKKIYENILCSEGLLDAEEAIISTQEVKESTLVKAFNEVCKKHKKIQDAACKMDINVYDIINELLD